METEIEEKITNRSSESLNIGVANKSDETIYHEIIGKLNRTVDYIEVHLIRSNEEPHKQLHQPIIMMDKNGITRPLFMGNGYDNKGVSVVPIIPFPPKNPPLLINPNTRAIGYGIEIGSSLHTNILPHSVVKYIFHYKK